MAKIMLGSLAGAISGALGNDVFSHNRHGAYVRRRVIPTKVNSEYTEEVRNILTSCSRAWGGLDAGEQAAWNTWAQSHPITDRLGQKQVLFGAGAYTQINARLMKSGDLTIDLPPTVAAPAPLLTLTLQAYAATQSVVMTFTPTPIDSNERLWIQAALLVNPGANYFKNLLKLVNVSDAEEESTYEIGTSVVERFGAFETDQRIIVVASILDTNTGLLSGPTLAECTVAAAAP